MKKYKKGKCIGRGAYGAAYIFTNKASNLQHVAKKIPLDGLPDDERKATAQEVELLRTLDHPNIVEYIESFTDRKNVLYIVMSFCEGGDLEGQIKRHAKSGEFLEEEVRFAIHVPAIARHPFLCMGREYWTGSFRFPLL